MFPNSGTLALTSSTPQSWKYIYIYIYQQTTNNNNLIPSTNCSTSSPYYSLLTLRSSPLFSSPLHLRDPLIPFRWATPARWPPPSSTHSMRPRPSRRSCPASTSTRVSPSPVPSAVPSPTEASLPSMCKWRQFLLQRLRRIAKMDWKSHDINLMGSKGRSWRARILASPHNEVTDNSQWTASRPVFSSTQPPTTAAW